MVKLFYTTYISVDLAHHEIFHAKVGKGGISMSIHYAMNRLLRNANAFHRKSEYSDQFGLMHRLI